ncbi:lysine biosynthesis protein LysW [Kroppenstedtia guangzhouensis]|jgi:alpha-aminoadipate/glutamate carrier protein LysW|uniref:Lysine biosynthesis protein LysW n=1 Tax=Kroppenstedtia guangzhouensis TaxID=1274356 RepID=A0ABQ1GI51_9BACL|nr:lysine biosynthesis protein LysW [Kroppenstedtia guangzhouensis]GGA43708.1 lysine biosynthesis protein LysW [Kroppenstedtia guangzhouensis]
MEKLACIVCKDEISVDQDATTGEIVECASCGQEHEVHITGDGVKVELAPEIEETWGE